MTAKDPAHKGKIRIVIGPGHAYCGPVDPEKARAVDERYLQEALALRPEVASLRGIGGDDAMPDPSPEGRAELLRVLGEWRDERDKISIDDRTFTFEIRQAALDHRVFSASLELFRFVAGELPRAQDPDRLSDISAVIANQLYAPGPAAERFSSLSARLNKLGDYLKAAVVDVDKADPFLLDAAERSVDRANKLVDLIGGRAQAAAATQQLSESALNDVTAAQEAARKSIADYGGWLKDQQPGETPYRPGPDHFEQLLHLRGLDITAAEMAELGRSMTEEMRIEERRLARRHFPGMSPLDALARARKTAPTSAPEAVAWLKELVGIAREHVLTSGHFASLPDEDLELEPSPPTVAGILPSLHLIPARGDLDPQPARLVVSIPADDDFANISLADLENLVGAHTYPGRHLFTVCTQTFTNPARLGVPAGIAHPLAATWGNEASSGWAHYSEEFMQELSFRNTPGARLLTVRYGLYRAVLSLVDVGLATGGFEREEAITLLANNGGASRAVAERDVTRCVRCPGWGLSALLGKMRLQQVRREAKKQWRHQYSDPRFHELVLKGGPMPLTYLFELVEDPPPFDAPADPRLVNPPASEDDLDDDEA